MTKKLTYAGYVSQKIKPFSKEQQQELRGLYFSNSGKIKQYDTYKAYCKEHKLDYDSPPDGYWESKEEPWHKPAGWAMVIGAYALMALGGAATSGIRTRNR